VHRSDATPSRKSRVSRSVNLQTQGCAVALGLKFGNLFTMANKSNDILAFVADVYEDLELWYPKLRLEEAGFVTRLAAPTLDVCTGKHGYPAKPDLLIADAKCENHTGLLIPGGFMPDKLRRDPKVLELTRDFFEAGKLVAFICHGGWIPISAKILRGKRATGSAGIRDDLTNAGAIWVDEAVVRDGNLISSRTPVDLPAFGKAMVDFLSQTGGRSRPS